MGAPHGWVSLATAFHCITQATTSGRTFVVDQDGTTSMSGVWIQTMAKRGRQWADYLH